MPQKFVNCRVYDLKTFRTIRYDLLPEKVVQERAVGLLELARSYIQNPANWIKGQYFGKTNVNADKVRLTAIEADQFCMIGSILKAREVKFGQEIQEEPEHVARRALHDASPRMLGESIQRFNDDPGTTHEMVLEAFEKAIKSFKVRKPRMNTLAENQKARRSVSRSKA